MRIDLIVICSCWFCGADHWPSGASWVIKVGHSEPIVLGSVCPMCSEESDLDIHWSKEKTA